MITGRAKRASALGLLPWSPMPPKPDGAIDSADRRQLAYTYRGEQPVPPGAHAHCTLEWFLPHTAEVLQI